MATAILSFATPGRLALTCADAGLDERRDLDDEAPFAAWSARYAAVVGTPAEADELLELGLQLGAWIDGEQQWLGRLLERVVPPLVLELRVGARLEARDHAILDVPWELVAAADGAAPRHLALDPAIRLSVVRRIGAPGEPRPPQPYRLSVVFMAALPAAIDGLEVDQRDCEFLASVERIGETTAPVGAELAVEESGSMAGLIAAAHARRCDVIHLCGSLWGDPPGLIFEVDRDGADRVVALAAADGRRSRTGDRGGHVVATAGELQQLALVPSLLVLSAGAGDAGATAGLRLAAELARRGWPAVLAWARPVADAPSLELAGALYRQLAARQPLAEALADVRRAGRPWHQARLVLGPGGGGRLIAEATVRAIRVRYPAGFLDVRRTVKVWRPSELFGYRRAVQETVAALRLPESTAVALHGADARLRASLAARAAASVDELRRVVIGRKQQDDPVAILRQLALVVGDVEVERRVRAYAEAPAAERPRFVVLVRELLERTCQRAGQGAILLVVHDLEVRRPRLRMGQLALAPGAPPVVAELVEAFHGAATESRLLLTSASRFAIYTAAGKELVGRIRFAPAAGIAVPVLAAARLHAKAAAKTSTAVSSSGAAASAVVAVATGQPMSEPGTWIAAAAAVLSAAVLLVATRAVSPRAAATAGGSSLALAAAALVSVLAVVGLGTQAASLWPAREADVERDAGIDAPMDAGIDAPMDAGIDAPMDAGIDAGIDAPVDAGIDARRDVADGGHAKTTRSNLVTVLRVCYADDGSPTTKIVVRSGRRTFDDAARERVEAEPWSGASAVDFKVVRDVSDELLVFRETSYPQPGQPELCD